MGFTVEMTPAIAEKLVTLNELHRNRWRPDIVNLLLETDTLRFGELKKQLGITKIKSSSGRFTPKCHPELNIL